MIELPQEDCLESRLGLRGVARWFSRREIVRVECEICQDYLVILSMSEEREEAAACLSER